MQRAVLEAGDLKSRSPTGETVVLKTVRGPGLGIAVPLSQGATGTGGAEGCRAWPDPAPPSEEKMAFSRKREGRRRQILTTAPVKSRLRFSVTSMPVMGQVHSLDFGSFPHTNTARSHFSGGGGVDG